METWSSRHHDTMEATGRLAQGVVHHLGNLLTVVQGNTGFVLDRTRDVRLRRELLEIRSVSERASTLTRHLSVLGGGGWLTPRTVDLRTLVSGFQLGRFVGGDVAFCTDLCSVPCWVWADPEAIEEVLFLLLMNAREAVADRGTIRLSVHRVSAGDAEAEDGSDWVKVELRDSGSGMDRATLSRAVEPFYSGRSRCMERGLGLSVVYGIVSRHGGAMQIRSGPGEGTAVRLWFPAVIPPNESGSAGNGRRGPDGRAGSAA